MSVVLYSKPNCGPCRATEQALRSRGLVPWQEGLPPGTATYEKIDVSEDAEALAFITETLGYRSVPVVYLDAGQHWSGFDPARIDAMKLSRDPSLP